ncbi:cyclin-dependent kinase inhibitor 2A-like [Watersipora subatra]|uniref:cyclin-dependent kinase inhibitor 2A-like n=1 Tax=Watersipora subatra TaxID=2589382 RepID=UPI00355AF76C
MANRLANAAADGDIRVVQKLLESGCEVNRQGADGMTPLAIASFWGYIDIVNVLLKHGADVNAVNTGTKWTALHSAAFQGHGPVVLSLLRAGSDVDALDAHSRSPADLASATDAIWPLFAAAGCTRTPKSELIEKRIIMKQPQRNAGGPTAIRPGRYEASSYLSRPGSAYVLDTRNLQNVRTSEAAYDAAVSGDVLANQNYSNNEQANVWQFS